MTTIPTRGQHRVPTSEAEREILAALAAGNSVQQLLQTPTFRVDDIAAVLRSRNLTVHEKTGAIVPAGTSGADDPLLMLLMFSKSRAVSIRARRVYAERTRLLGDFAEAQARVQQGELGKLTRAHYNALVDFLSLELNSALQMTRALKSDQRRR